MGSQNNFQDADLNSPGYEYLRSYSSMGNLYYKLVALNYLKEFCPLYKCPPIHRYYFATQLSNQVEQQFTFMCLCIWLMKDKCQMNFDTDPRDYQDPDSTISVIYEAMSLLVPEGDSATKSAGTLAIQPFPMARLKRGFGPEVIFCLNKFADRALELTLEQNPNIGPAEIHFQHKQKVGGREQTRSTSSIMIGQPIVGGGLTTRPLGNYQIDDSSLVLGDTENSSATRLASDTQAFTPSSVEWQQEQLEKIAPLFEMIYEVDDKSLMNKDWREYSDRHKSCSAALHQLSEQSRPILEALEQRIDYQLQIVSGRESALMFSSSECMEQFRSSLREFSKLQLNNEELSNAIDLKTAAFESCAQKLKELRSRLTKMTDGSRLKEVERLIRGLDLESEEMELKFHALDGAEVRGAKREGFSRNHLG